MSRTHENEIRRYLLGSLPDAARERIEEQLLFTDEGLAEIELAEETLIDDYLSGDLSDDERRRFETDFLCTEERRRRVAHLRALRRLAAQAHPEPAPASERASFPSRLRRWLGGLAMAALARPALALGAAVLAIGLAIGATMLWRMRSSSASDIPPASLLALNKAYAGARPLESRIADLAYAPFAVTRGGPGPDADARLLRERAGRVLLDAVADAPTPANRHALGKYYLAEKRFNDAIEQFKTALPGMPRSAELLSDLGAALLERARLERQDNHASESLRTLAESLETLQQALTLRPDLQPAVFNRALCLQELHLPQEAAREWRAYLRLDSSSAWANEARRNLDALEKSPSKIKLNDDALYREFLRVNRETDPQRAWTLFCQGYSTTGNAIVEGLVDDHLAARQTGQTARIEETLASLEHLGTLAHQQAQDPYIRDLARYYEHVTPTQAALLLEARRELNEGRKARTSSQPQAIAHYASALSRFRQAGDEMESRLSLCLMGRSYLRQSDLEKSAELLEPLASEKNIYLWLRGEALNGASDRYFSRGLPDQAIRASQEAMSIARRLGNIGLLIRSDSLLVEQYKDLGNQESALNYNFQALDLATANPLSHDERWAVFGVLALTLYSNGFQAAAVACQQEALGIVLQAPGKELQLSRAYSHLGAILGNEGRYAEGIAALEKAYAIGIGLSRKGDRRGLNIQTYSGPYLANLYRKAGDPRRALDEYRRLIDLNRQLGAPASDFEAYRGKAIAELAVQNRRQAQQDLATAIDLFERNLRSILAEKDRMMFFDKEYDLYDLAIELISEESSEKAFSLCEKNRARVLREGLAQGPPAIDLDALRRQLAGHVKIVQYACLPNRLMIWLVGRDAFVQRRLDIPLASLNEKVAAFIQAVSTRNDAAPQRTEQASRELYAILIEPIESLLSPGDQLTFVPDKTLNHLPFAALYSSRKNRYLIEEFPILASPSATVFLRNSMVANQRFPRLGQTPLVVGNPRVNRADAPSLPPLPAAAREAREIAVIHHAGPPLIDSRATEAEIKKRLPAATLVHIAAHGVVAGRFTTDSMLMLGKLAAGDEEDGLLHTYEISAMRLPRTSLVVLSACQSGVERFYRGEGMMGLARAFLMAEVPTVVASLWAIDSDQTSSLMISFHKHLQTHTASTALRLAQLEMVHQADSRLRHPYYWAAFSVFGGDRLT